VPLARCGGCWVYRNDRGLVVSIAALSEGGSLSCADEVEIVSLEFGIVMMGYFFLLVMGWVFVVVTFGCLISLEIFGDLGLE